MQWGDPRTSNGFNNLKTQEALKIGVIKIGVFVSTLKYKNPCRFLHTFCSLTMYTSPCWKKQRVYSLENLNLQDWRQERDVAHGCMWRQCNYENEEIGWTKKPKGLLLAYILSSFSAQRYHTHLRLNDVNCLPRLRISFYVKYVA